MRQICCAALLLLCATGTIAQKNSYLFIWVGDDAKAGSGLVEVTLRGELVRSSSAMDKAAAAELIRPYSLVVMPSLDRVVTTNTAMHEEDGNGRTVQVCSSPI